MEVKPIEFKTPFWIRVVRIFLLILIAIGIVLLCTQKLWVPKLVAHILTSEGVPYVID